MHSMAAAGGAGAAARVPGASLEDVLRVAARPLGRYCLYVDAARLRAANKAARAAVADMPLCDEETRVNMSFLPGWCASFPSATSVHFVGGDAEHRVGRALVHLRHLTLETAPPAFSAAMASVVQFAPHLASLRVPNGSLALDDMRALAAAVAHVPQGRVYASRVHAGLGRPIRAFGRIESARTVFQADPIRRF
jgi:hypothetical protein